MSSFNFPIKRSNHRVHPCNKSDKLALLKLLVSKKFEENSSVTIVVVSKQKNDEQVAALESFDASQIKIIDDSEVSELGDQKYDLLISLDLPSDVRTYMLRIVATKTEALILLDENEQHLLYPIETILQRAILQEIIPGFSPIIEAERSKTYRPVYKKHVSKEDRKLKYLAQHEEKEASPSDTSTKTGERNHHYNGTPKSDDEKFEHKKKKNDYNKKPFNKDFKPLGGKKRGKKIIVKSLKERGK